jgi:hypothetical protein
VQIAAVLRELFALLEKCGIEFMVGGSFASGAWGEPRQTNDIDIVVRLGRNGAACLQKSAQPLFQLGEMEMGEALESKAENASFQMLHTEALFKIDAFILSTEEFVQSAFDRKQKIEIVPGLYANCASPEDMVLQKLRWFELGNRVSDRQWNDLVKILEIQRDTLDNSYIDGWADRLGLSKLLIRAREEAWDGE